MRTLITGSSGFVGLALSELLLEAGEDVIGYDIRPAGKRVHETFSTLPGRFIEEKGDVCDLSQLKKIIAIYNPQCLVILAAITADARRERQDPQAIFNVNVGGVLAAISAAPSTTISRIILVSSGAVYGSAGRTTKLLDEALTPLSPEGLYGISKHCSEESAIRLSFLQDIPLFIGRLGTCFGPWEADTGFRDTLSAPMQILELARQGQRAVLPRDSCRDWLYVRDAAKAISCLLFQGHLKHQVYNLAPGLEWSLGEWCDHLTLHYPNFTWTLAKAGERANVNLYGDYDRASMAVHRLKSDCSFTASFNLETAVNDYHQWIIKNNDAQ